MIGIGTVCLVLLSRVVDGKQWLDGSICWGWWGGGGGGGVVNW